MHGYNATVGALNGGANAVVDILSSGGASTLTVGNNNASSTFTRRHPEQHRHACADQDRQRHVHAQQRQHVHRSDTINTGTLTITMALAAQNSTVALSGGSLGLDGLSAATFGGLTGTAGPDQQLRLTVGNNNVTSSYGGVLTARRQPDQDRHRHLHARQRQHVRRQHHHRARWHFGHYQRQRSPNSTLVTPPAFQWLGLSSVAFGGLSGSSNLSGQTSSIALTVGSNNQSTAYSGVLGVNGPYDLSLTKTGTGILTLSGANTYGGATTISQGTLKLGARTSFPMAPARAMCR